MRKKVKEIVEVRFLSLLRPLTYENAGLSVING